MTKTTDAEAIVDVLARVVPDGGTALAQHHGEAAVAPAREMAAALAPRLAENSLTAGAWEAFRRAPETDDELLVNAVALLLRADAALARRLDALLADYQRAIGRTTSINTGGGAYIGGDIDVSGGDFVGRDSIRITGNGNVVGDYSSATVISKEGLGAAEVERLFRRAMDLAQAKPPAVREDLEVAVETVEEETEKGEAADKTLLSKALDVLLERGPDVLELVLEAVLNPAAAAGKGARWLARDAKSKLAQRRKSK